MRTCLLASVLVVGLTGMVAACDFCRENRGPTLIGDFKQADMVIVGKFSDSRLGKAADFESDFKITEVLKPHAFLKGKGVVTLPKNKVSDNPFVIYMDLFKGELDPYRGIEVVERSDVVDYLKGAMKIAEAPAPQRLKYAFPYLQSDDFEVSLDAYREFAQADYKDYKEMALSLSPETIAGWLTSDKTPPYRYGLYASLLGHAGLKDASKYGQVLKGMIDDPEKRKGSGIDGLLAGYAMLQPREALAYLQDALGKPKEDFLLRYACLRTVRFLWEQRADLLPDKDIVKCMVLVANLPDMSDFAIEDLRRWNRWEAAPALFQLFGERSHDTTLIKRAIARFAIHARAQGNKDAEAFLAKQDASWIRGVQDILEREVDIKKPYERAK